MSQVVFQETRDGHPAARVAHLTFAMIPTKGMADRIMHCWPARDPSQCVATDFTQAVGTAETPGAFRAYVEEFAEDVLQKNALRRLPGVPTDTPWGMADRATIYGEGVTSYTTPRHGGFILSDERNALVDPAWRSRAGDYEEDQEWAVVAVTFPDLFTSLEMKHAHRTLKNAYPDEWERITGGVIALGESHERSRREFMTRNAGRLMVRSAVMSRKHPGMVVATATPDLKPATPTSPLFLIPEALYNSGCRGPGNYAFVIDEARDQRINVHEEPIVDRFAA